jgi:ABC-type dipeptide/oligopeptide/nickel transport system permease component
MVRYCVSSRSVGPRCYDITESQNSTLQILTIGLLVSVLVLVILAILAYLRKNQHNLSKELPFQVFGIAVFAFWAALIVYQSLVTSKSKLLCSGYVECRVN